ncbi:MAG: xylose isomerase-like protein [Actinomycetia bacterium]|nr:xylose isomerase-like protein [Actinomycetes bacterium]
MPPRGALGVVDVVYVPAPVEQRAQLAAVDGFAHIDVMLGTDPATLALPIGCPTAFPKPQPVWCATPAPRDEPGMWDRAVRWWRAAPNALLEPWAGACVNSLDKVRAFRDAVPGVRLLVDTGHVADWGGDPCELLEYADHVQLRQGKAGTTQLHVDDPEGAVDFAAVFARLDALGYDGRLSVEYFDLPDNGWPLSDPREWAGDLARAVRPLLVA